MNKTMNAAGALLCGAALSWACLPPPNIAGVAFTAGEGIDWAALDSMGEPGVNYFREGRGDTVSYRYRSHYSPDAMAYIGNMGLSYLENVRLECMGVILSEKIDPAAFDFARAVAVELAWLAAAGVLQMDSGTIAAIEDSLAAAGRGGVQYWTAQETVLGYNSWFTYDSASGTWGGTGAVRGQDGVNSVKGVYGGCSIVDVAFGMPPEPMEAGAFITGPRPRRPVFTEGNNQVRRDLRGRSIPPGAGGAPGAVIRKREPVLLIR